MAKKILLGAAVAAFTILPIFVYAQTPEIAAAIKKLQEQITALQSKMQQLQSDSPAITAEKATYFRFDNLNSGSNFVFNEWVTRDFGVGIVNPSGSPINVTMTMHSDDPSFTFIDGSKGSWSKTYTVSPLQGLVDNIYDAYGQKFFTIPQKTSWKGWVEFKGSTPFYIYSPLLLAPPVGRDFSHDLAFREAWAAWQASIDVNWDAELGKFLVPYTNYWHNHPEWPAGWHTLLSITNNSGAPVEYTIEHRPNYGRYYDANKNCAVSTVGPQTVKVILGPGGKLSDYLENIFGWNKTARFEMEGILLISPRISGNIITVSGMPNTVGSVSCSFSTDVVLTPPISTDEPVSVPFPTTDQSINPAPTNPDSLFSPIPTASLSVLPHPVPAEENVTYSWSSTGAVSWSWSIIIVNSDGVVVPADGCGTQASNWFGPPGGNSASGSWTGATTACQASYTYYIYYRASNASGETTQSPAAIVTVNPVASQSQNSIFANIIQAIMEALKNLSVKLDLLE